MRHRISSPEQLVNTSSPSVRTGVQGIPSVILVNSENPKNLVNNPSTTLMVGIDVRLPTFNGNGIEALEQHWFLYEVVWMVLLVKNDDIQKVQIITTLQGHALDWYMKYCVVLLGQP